MGRSSGLIGTESAGRGHWRRFREFQPVETVSGSPRGAAAPGAVAPVTLQHVRPTEESMELGLKNRVAVITGGSKGIGKAIGQALAAEGVHLLLLARGMDQLEAAAQEIRTAFGVRVAAISADITSTESVKAAVEATRAEFPAVHVLVNNAGGPIRRMDRQITWSDSDWMDDLNLKAIGMLRVIQAFLPLLTKDGSGRIINVSGVAGTSVWMPALTHGINNSAMNHATSYLAQDLAADHITVNAVSPGLVGTEAREAWAANMAKQQGKTRDEFLADFCKRMGILAGRWAEMDEIASAVVFLASDRARYITGTRLFVDGGFSVNARPA
jgi:3-oxoacyl-[acyl-carrier protein] reductase